MSLDAMIIQLLVIFLLYPTTIQELLGNLLMLIPYILFITASIYHHHHHLNSLHGITNNKQIKTKQIITAEIQIDQG